jgi:hypothetical protein
MLSEEEDSPLPPVRVSGRFDPTNLTRVAAPRPTPLGPNRGANSIRGPRPTKADLIAKAKQVDKMASKLAASRRLSPPAAAAASTAPPSVSTGDSADDLLGVAEHVALLAQLSVAPEQSSEGHTAALNAALASAVSSLNACERVQSQTLQRSVNALKEDFRSRLEALEAEFVRRAEALSDELAAAVAERKQGCADAVARHAEQLSDEIISIRDDPDARLDAEAGGISGGGEGHDDNDDDDDDDDEDELPLRPQQEAVNVNIPTKRASWSDSDSD